MTRTNRLSRHGLACVLAGCVALVAQAASAALFSQNFDATPFPPPGWFVTNYGTGPIVWKSNADYSDTNYTGGGATGAEISSAAYPRYTYNAGLIGPAISLPASAPALELRFRSVLETWSGDEAADVDVSLDSGATWTNILRWQNLDHREGQAAVSLMPYLGKTITLRFRYYNLTSQSWDLYWQIDDARIVIPLAGDVTLDDTVDAMDLLSLASSWGLTSTSQGFNAACDINHDNAVDVVDLLFLADNWGRSS